MHDNDRPAFKRAIQILCATFRVEPSPALLEAYFIGLDDLDIGVIQAAVKTCIRTSRHMPVVADLRAAAGVSTSSLEAWAKVRAQIAAVGFYGQPELNDLEARAVSALGGWQRLCQTESRDLDFLGKTFVELHQNYEHRSHALPAMRSAALDSPRGRKINALAK